jgi:hypothetical protein
VERDAPDQLHIEVPHPQGAPCRLAYHREGLGQQLIERRAFLQARAKLLGLGAQRLIAHLLDLRLELVGGTHGATVAAHHALITAAKNAGEELAQGVTRSGENIFPDKHLPYRRVHESGVLYA